MESNVLRFLLLVAVLHSVTCQYMPNPACKSEHVSVNFTSKPGYCTWMGQCIENKATTGMFNCYYNGPAINPSHDKELIQILNQTCPEYVKGPGGRDTRVCCDIAQIKQLQNQTGIARSLFSRCPACLKNFMKHFCFTTCDPDMSLYIKPQVKPLFGDDMLDDTVLKCTDGTKTPNNSLIVEGVNVIIDDKYGEKLFNSCSNVQYPQQSGKVISMMCGDVKVCTASDWLKFLGDPSLDYNQAPFLMRYTFANESMEDDRFTTNLTKCDDKGDDQCSCSDCPSHNVCPPPLKEAPSSNLLKYIMFGVSGLCLILTLILFFGTALPAIFSLCEAPTEDTEDDRNSSSSSHESINNGEPIDEKPRGLHFCSLCDFCYGKGLYPLVQIGAWMEFVIKALFYRWGLLASRGWFIVLPAAILVFGGLSVGILKFTITTDPVKLWSAPNSQARLEKDYFDTHFGPFYRTEQVIIRPNPGISNYSMTMPGETQSTDFNPVFNWIVLKEIYEMQTDISNLVAYRENGSNVTLKDICFKPLSPDNNDCVIESIINYFQNNFTRLNYREANDFHTETFNASCHINYCTRNPTAVKGQYASNSEGKFGCLGAYGGPIDPNTALGGFPTINGNNQYNLATATLVTFIVNNHVNDEDNKDAELWEAEFIKYLKKYNGPHRNISVTFMSERSITDEINRESKTDELTILISYVVMFLYIAIFLGKIRTISTVLVDLKILLGLCGVLIVLLAVAASVGFLSLVGIEGSLIILEVVPFLVLAVGVDNLFILVHSYERQHKAHATLPVHQIVARALAEVAPSLILTATSESAAFLLGAISDMPAVRTFSLYAGVAVFFNFLLQISAFVSVMYLDAWRTEKNALDVFWFMRLPKSSLPIRTRPGFLSFIMHKFLSRLILHKLARPIILLLFGVTFSVSVFSFPWLKAGLDQNLALPKDSYLQPYFHDLYAYLHIGAPVYFVIKGGLNLTNLTQQDKICSGSFCDKYSVGTQIAFASTFPNVTHIAEPGSIWLDSYYEWLDPSSTCCGHLSNDTNTMCDNPVGDPSDDPNDKNVTCVHCLKSGSKRPTSDEYLQFLEPFFTSNPNTKCAAAGHAAYNHAVVIDYNSMNKDVKASYIMTFHTISSTSDQFISALKQARKIADNLTATAGVEVFPYSVFYVYYDQYLHTSRDMLLNIGVSLGAVFLVTTAMMGLNVWGACMVIITVIMILVHLIGVMVILKINANAVSLVNLVMTVGIAVEFSAHIVRWFISCKGTSRLVRARSALSNMGSSVISGITITKFLGVFILAFAKSQLFFVYYFQMYLSMVIIGALHGLVYLPVLLSYFGPPYVPVQCHSPYPVDQSESRVPATAPITSEEIEKKKQFEDANDRIRPSSTSSNHSTNNGGMYPNLDPYQGYGAPTYSNTANENTPLIS